MNIGAVARRAVPGWDVLLPPSGEARRRSRAHVPRDVRQTAQIRDQLLDSTTKDHRIAAWLRKRHDTQASPPCDGHIASSAQDATPPEVVHGSISTPVHLPPPK